MTTGTTPICAHCGRPVLGSPMKVGVMGEIYHFECTLSPYAKAVVERMDDRKGEDVDAWAERLGNDLGKHTD